MAKSKSLPQHAVRVPTFAALEQYVQAFAAGHLNLLMIFGHPGAGKSRCVRQALGSQVCWISGQASPFGIYLQAYEHRHQPLVLDDIDGLYADRSGIRLLKALGQTERTKTLCWPAAVAGSAASWHKADRPVNRHPEIVAVLALLYTCRARCYNGFMDFGESGEPNPGEAGALRRLAGDSGRRYVRWGWDWSKRKGNACFLPPPGFGPSCLSPLSSWDRVCPRGRTSSRA